MLMAKDLMDANLVCVDPDDTVGEVAAAMRRCGRDGLPVVNMPGQLLGFVTERDLWDLAANPEVVDRPVYHYMTRQVHTVDHEARLDEVAEVFRVLPFHRLPVTRENVLVGVIDRHEVLGRVAEQAGQSRRSLHVAPHAVPAPRERSRGATTPHGRGRRSTRGAAGLAKQ